MAANVKKNKAYHGSLTADSVDEVTLTRSYEQIEVMNRSGAAEIYYTLDGTNPTVGGDDTMVVPAVITSDVQANPLSDQNTAVVKLISSGTPTYTVRGVGNAPGAL